MCNTKQRTEAFVALIRACPEFTLLDMLQLAQAARVQDIVRAGDVFKGRKVSTRTKHERRTFDAAVLAAVAAAEHSITAPEIRASTGGTPLQLRKALRRLIKLRQVCCVGGTMGHYCTP